MISSRKLGEQKKKIRETKGTFHANMGTIKDRNGMDLTEGEDNQKEKIIRSTGITDWLTNRERSMSRLYIVTLLI